MWGGLGSQLFGVSLVHSLKKRFPNRSIITVLHSSGVTRRDPEIIKLFPELDFVISDDFIGRAFHDSGSKKFSLKSLVRRIMRRILLLSSLLSQENYDSRSQIRFWTLEIRGHYLYRQVSADFLNLLLIRLEAYVNSDFEEFRNSIVLHYRLGDLLELSNKGFVEPNRISSILNCMQESANVSVFSDSPDVAILLLGNKEQNKNLESVTLPTVETVYAASRGAAFVGTSSKISYWIVLLRLAISDDSVNYLPLEDKPVITFLNKSHSGVCFY